MNDNINQMDLLATGVLDSSKPTRSNSSENPPRLTKQKSVIKKQMSVPTTYTNVPTIEVTDYSVASSIAKKTATISRTSSLKRLTRQQSFGFPIVPYSQINPHAFTRPYMQSLNEFINNGPYTTKTYKIDKINVIRSAFSKDLDIIYDDNASRMDKIRRILLSPQWNLIIIFLILLDWLVAVCSLLINMYKAESMVEEFAKFFSIGLLSFFILEIILKILLLPGIFFRSKLEIFDTLIVVISFTFEIVLITRKLDFAGVSSILTMFRYE